MNSILIIKEEVNNYINGINPRDRKEKFLLSESGEIFNKKGERIGKIKYIKSRSILKIVTTFTQEIKIEKRKQLKK